MHRVFLFSGLFLYSHPFWHVNIFCVYMVSPPQMPVPLKHMYNANILRAEFTIFVPNYPPLWYTIIIPQLSFFKNRSENGMLSSTVLSYSPLKVKWSNLPRSPQIFLRLFTENTHILLTTVTIRKSHNTVKPHVTHEENNVCLQIIHKVTTFPYFF